MVPTGIVHQTRLADEVGKAIRKLGKGIVRVNYSMGTDSTGESSIFFRIVLTDAASREDKLADEPRNPKQASLRRALSTAYYALFHLLISEAVANWNRVNLRQRLAGHSITT